MRAMGLFLSLLEGLIAALEEALPALKGKGVVDMEFRSERPCASPW